MPSVLWDERKVAPDRGRKTLNKRRKTHRERESNQVSLSHSERETAVSFQLLSLRSSLLWSSAADEEREGG